MGSNWNIKISKTMHVPMTKYLEVRERYQSLQKALQDEIAAEKVYKEEKRKIKKSKRLIN